MRLPILLVLAVVTINLSAQDSLKTTNSFFSKFGVRGGLNVANLFADNVAGESSKIGFNLGIYAKFPISTNVTFQPELNYTDNGAVLTYNNSLQGTGKYRYNLDYLQLAALLKIKLAGITNIYIGPYVAHSVNMHIKRVDTNNGAVSSVTNLTTDDFNRSDVGVVGGIGFDINKYTIGARYSYGFNEVGKPGSTAEMDTKNSRNYVASLYIAFGF